jgi:hypothetical protein
LSRKIHISKEFFFLNSFFTLIDMPSQSACPGECIDFFPDERKQAMQEYERINAIGLESKKVGELAECLMVKRVLSTPGPHHRKKAAIAGGLKQRYMFPLPNVSLQNKHPA